MESASACGASADYPRRVSAELEPVYLLVGSDRPKIQRALRRLRERVGEDAVERLSAASADAAAAVAACNALGFFGGEARLVEVDEVERWKAADAKAIRSYLANPTPETVLALTGELKPDSPLAKAVAQRGEVLVYDVPKRALPAWVGEQFRRHGVDADDEARRALIELVGENVEELETEIEKLATWAAGEPISVTDVETLVAGRAETAIFAVTDAWGRRDVASALAACEALLDRSARARRDEVARIAASLAGHVARVRACQALAAEGVRARDAAPRLKMHPFAAEKAFAQAESYSVDELRDAVVRLARLDHALKGGSRLSAELELERALADITRAADAAGRT